MFIAMMNPPLPETLSLNAGIRVQKLLGRSYLRENRLEDAIQIFLGILKTDPDDVDGLLILANLYRAGGSPLMAKRLYKKAYQINPENALIQDLLVDLPVNLEDGGEEDDPLEPEAIARLMERLESQGRDDQLESIRDAADILLDNFLPDGRLRSHNSRQAREMQQLMPALIEINVRQARAAGQTELAEALQSLQIHMTHQVVEPVPSVSQIQLGQNDPIQGEID